MAIYKHVKSPTKHHTETHTPSIKIFLFHSLVIALSTYVTDIILLYAMYSNCM